MELKRDAGSSPIRDESPVAARDGYDGESTGADTRPISEGHDEPGMALVTDDAKAPWGLFDDEASDDAVRITCAKSARCRCSRLQKSEFSPARLSAGITSPCWKLPTSRGIAPGRPQLN